jgi:probable HAF family extracellular repeat protein
MSQCISQRRPAFVGGSLAIAALAIALPASAADLKVDYTLVEGLQGALRTIPYGINAAGTISGTAVVQGAGGIENVGFLWHKATNSYTVIDLGSAGYTGGRGINDAGVVVGEYLESELSSQPSGFVYDSATGVTTTNPSILYRGISNAGDLAGRTLTQPDGTIQAVRVWQGYLETFSCFDAFATVAEGINVSGDVVGIFDLTNGYTGAFLYHNGECIDISIPGANVTEAWGINDRGDIVGDWGMFSATLCQYGAFYRHDGRVDLTRAACQGFPGTIRPVNAGLLSISNDRTAAGEIFGISAPNFMQMFYGPIRGADKD